MGDALLDLTLSNKEKLQGKVKPGGSLSCTHHEVVKFRIMRRKIMAKSITPWASGEQTFAYSVTCLEKSHGIQPWREEEVQER